jgi:hypothetical protein
MRSREEQEEFLQHGRFGEGKQSPTRTPVPCLVASGPVLVIAGLVYSFSFRIRDAQGMETIGFVLLCGSVLSAVVGFLERTGSASLVTSTVLLLVVGGTIISGSGVALDL